MVAIHHSSFQFIYTVAMEVPLFTLSQRSLVPARSDMYLFVCMTYYIVARPYCLASFFFKLVVKPFESWPSFRNFVAIFSPGIFAKGSIKRSIQYAD